MKTRNIGLALLLVAALSSQTMLGLTPHEITRNRDAIKKLLSTPVSVVQSENKANADKLKLHRDTLKKNKKLTNEATVNQKIQDFEFGRTREEAETVGVAGASACSSDLIDCKKIVAIKDEGIDLRDKDIEAANEEIDFLEGKVASRNTEIDMLKSEKSGLERQLATAQADAASEKGANALLAEEIRDLNEKLEEIYQLAVKREMWAISQKLSEGYEDLVNDLNRILGGKTIQKDAQDRLDRKEKATR